MFNLKASFEPTGDQPQAIEKLTENLKNNIKNQVLLGVTGSGKSLTYDQSVIVKSRLTGAVREVKIGAFVDQYMSKNYAFSYENSQIVSSPDMGERFQALSWNPKTCVSEFCDISYLTSFIKPKVGIVLNVGPAHLEKFGTLEAVAKEKGKLVEVLPKNGLAVLNEDDPYVKGMAQLSSAHIEFFRDRRLENETAVATIIGQFYKIEEKLIKQGLGKIEKLPQRMVWLNGKKGCTIIDDSYNANPLSMKWALDVLAKQEGRRVAVLGEMAQQGKNSGQAHQEVIDLAKKSADQIILVGKEFQNMSDIWFKDSQSAAENIGKYIQKGDMVLVKGSRSTQMEKIVDMLKE